MFSNLNNQAGSSNTGSSLFSNLGGTATNNSTPATSAPQATGSSLFGSALNSNNNNAAQNQAKPSLFGSLGGANTNTTNNTTGTGSSLFANLGGGGSGTGATQTSAAPSGGSLFGASTGNAPQPAAGSLFGTKPASSQPAAGSSLFGQSTAQTANQGTSSLFGATQQQQQQQPQQQQQQGSLGQSLLGSQAPASTQPAFFNSLLERGKKRTFSASRDNGGLGDLPALQLGLDDIRRKARELGGGATGTPQQYGADSRAHYLLAASGISPGKALRDLKALNTQATAADPYKQSQADFDPDSEKYFRGIQQRSRQAMIADSLARVHRDFDAFLDEKVNFNWDEQRQRIYEHFGLVQRDDSQNDGTPAKGAFGRTTAGASQAPRKASTMRGSGRRSVFGKSGLDKSIIGSPNGGPTSTGLFTTDNNGASSLNAPDTRFMREKMGYFAEKVQRLNEARLQEKVFPVLQEFAIVEEHAGGDAPAELFDAYCALMKITKENPKAESVAEPGAIKERQFAEDYLNETPNSRGQVELRKRIIEGSRSFFEDDFLREIETTIAKNPREAQLGGIPTVTNKIRAYIRLREARKDLAPDGSELQMVGNDYCWVLIYYLLRCGLVTEAAEYVSRDPGFRSLDHKFVTYMTTYAQSRRLPRDLQQKINGEYQQRSRNAPDNTVDPYRIACYKIVGRCDLSKKVLSDIHQSIKDWMWLQFVLAREDDRAEEVAGEVFGLTELRSDIEEIGRNHFSKGAETGGGYGVFFLLQILGGLFEQAVSWLATYNPVSAVHFAIALDFYGLMRVSDFYTSGEELLSYTTKQQPQINFGYLITRYTQEFRTGNVEAATDYFALICLNADLPGALGKSQASVCHEALREFILETRDFARLLGDIRDDGTRIKGAIEQRLRLIKLVDQDDFLRAITVQAAAIADDKGLTADAVLLYHLAEDYDHVIDVINRALSDTVAVDLGGATLKIQPLKPRAAPGDQQEAQYQPGSSLSLTAVDDPLSLARNMIGLYNSNALYFQKIRQINRDTCGMLMRMIDARHKVEAGKWMDALDIIDALHVLPLRARGDINYIRSHASTSFTTLPPLITRNIGALITWCITCIGQIRDSVRGSGSSHTSSFDTPDKRALFEEMEVMARDLSQFVGLVRYKLSERVFDGLARVGGGE